MKLLHAYTQRLLQWGPTLHLQSLECYLVARQIQFPHSNKNEKQEKQQKKKFATLWKLSFFFLPILDFICISHFYSFFFFLLWKNTKKNSSPADTQQNHCTEIDHQTEKEKIDDESQKSDSSSPDPNSNEVIIPILNKKNGPILQSQ